MTVMEKADNRAGGRPRGFNREAALDVAMRLFWRHGFDGVSFQQLTTELGVAPPSLYAAFGNKAALYRAALDRYAAMRGASDLSFMDTSLSLHEVLRPLLDGTARALLDPKGEAGCMLNTGMIASHPDHADLALELTRRRDDFRMLLAQRLLNWVPGSKADRMARYLTTIMQGMAIQAHDGCSLDELLAVASDALDTIPDARAAD